MLYPEGMVDLKLINLPFLEEEIQNAVFSLPKDKAPGLDGFLISFYQHFRDTIRGDLLNQFKGLHISTTNIFRLNYSHNVYWVCS